MSNTFAFRLLLAATAPLAAAGFLPAAAQAQSGDPAVQKIDAFDTALIQLMKDAKSAGPQARFKSFAPAVDAALDVPVMTAFSVGPLWATAAAEDKAATIAAFRRFTVASYVKNFNSYGGQAIAVTPDVQTRGPDKLVKTQMTGGGSNVTLIYRMRLSASGSWKVIDVIYNGSVSQLSSQRSDFSSTVASGGLKALIAKLDALTEKLLK